MNESLRSDTAPYLVELGPYDEEVLQLLRFRLVERVSRVFELHLELASRRPDLSLDDVLGEKAVLTLRGPEGERYVHGIVAEFETGDSTQHHHMYQAVVRPRLWLGGQRSNCRIFQAEALDAILPKILGDHALSTGLDFKFQLQGTHPAREYCVQYRESDLDFVSRLCEEEGVFYYFDHGAERAQVVFGDHPGAAKSISGDPELRIAPRSGMLSDDESEQVFELRMTSAVRSGAFASSDYQFKQPSSSLLVTEKSKEFDSLEVFDYPGEYGDAAQGKTLAAVRLEEQRASRKVLRGRSNSVRFFAGATFEVFGSPRDDVDGKYFIVEVVHRGSSPQSLEESVALSSEARYANEFMAIPADVPYRPPRETARPEVKGSQPAIVCGPGGEEIYCDEFGRVKVRFYWDRYSSGDQKSSCWVRASQPWADGGWGGMAIPRIGQEVLVDFLEGDPDQPVIVGRMFNGEKLPPNALPEQKSKMTIRSQSLGGGGGSNEITFDDTGGTEHFYEHAQYDLRQEVEHDRQRWVGNDETVEVDGNKSDTIGANKTLRIGVDHAESIGGNMSITVGASLVETVAVAYSENVGAAMSVTVGGVKSESVGASRAVTVGGTSSEMIGGSKSSRVGGESTIEVMQDQSVTIGGDFKEKVGKKKQVDIGDSLRVTAKKIQIEAKDELLLKVGSAEILMKKNGDITLKGNKIQIKGSGDVIIKGSKVAQN